MNFNSLEISTHQELGNGEVLAVDLRRLHQALGSNQQFTHWVKNRLRETQADEGVDFLTDKIIYQAPSGDRTVNRMASRFIATLDLAKEIAMLERNEHGKRIRRYFIEAEKNYRKNAVSQSPEMWMAAKLLEAIPAKELLRLLNVRHPYGSRARNGKPRMGYRSPAFVAANHREKDAMAFHDGVIRLDITVQLELPKFAEALAALERK